MKLGFYYHIPAINKHGKIFMPGYQGVFIDSLAKHVESIVAFQHLPDAGENKIMDYQIRSKNVRLISLAPRGSVPHRMLHMREFTQKINQHLDEFDAILLRGPTPLLPPIANKIKKPSILLIVGDQSAGVDSLPQPHWRKEAIRLFWKWNDWQQLRIAKRSLTFVNSHLLYRQFEGRIPNLVETRTTTLGETDFYIRKDTCLNRPIRLLYTGRMDPTKGLLDMVEAMSILVEQGEEVVLDLVGWTEEGSTILDQIQQLAADRKVADKILYLGYQPVGPALFSFYKQADIYLIASQSSFEGFPRTIWEAMAHSLPVVTTRVGSIPDFIEGAAMIINPNNVDGIVDAVKELINNPKQRQKLINIGQIIARKNTLNRRSLEMISAIEDYLKTPRGNAK